jgi:hypothetical protein
MPEAEELAQKIAVHEAVCAERWKSADKRLQRIEWILTAIVTLLMIGEGSVVEVIKRLLVAPH